ncbi:hypothetical protein F7725_015826 [Dissostichus mawsoni]|uniref:Uncharacterized protein n=1 Tax=Dissostichus mawsoni TaxID=36200 RepID=A0A7J5YKQ8_DISMA|nr:hypothetical protein F7725_015826 [Dissostichus mawsoni]
MPGQSGGGWSILRWGPALFCLGTVGWCCCSVRDSCRRLNSPERRVYSSPLLPPPPPPPPPWFKKECFPPAGPSSLLLWELTELWHSDPESFIPRGDTGRQAAIWYTGFWKERGARSWAGRLGVLSVARVGGVWPDLLRVGPPGMFPCGTLADHTPKELTPSLRASEELGPGPPSRLRGSWRSTMDRLLLPLAMPRPVEMLQPASGGGEPESSEEGPGVIWTQDGLDRAELTSRRILGRGPSLEATLCEEGDTRQRKHNSGALQYVNWSTWSIWNTTSERRECRVESSLPRSMYPSKPAVLEMVSGFEISSRKRCMLVHSCSRNWFMKDMYSSLLPNLKANKDRKGDNEECKTVILSKFKSSANKIGTDSFSLSKYPTLTW